MFNSYGWIQLGVNQKDVDFSNRETEDLYDKLDLELYEKAHRKLEKIAKDDIIRFQFIHGMNNLRGFVSIALSRNHFSSSVREFYRWIAEISDGSHGILYEISNEDENFNPERPYRIWRLVGKNFEECKEDVINDKYHIVDY